jgi:O-antigen/teichoic acid export membrane protein
VSNVISPLMGNIDRLLIGALVPIAAVGMYATAFDVTTKVLVVAYSLTGAAFPMFAALQEHGRMTELYATVSKVMLATVWPVLFLLSLFADPLYRHWLSPDFVPVAAPATQILAIGLYFNCLAQVPAMLIQSRGSPRWMAMLHLCEVPVFLGVIYGLTWQYGVIGTAAAWTLRTTFDSLVLHELVRRRLARGALSVRHVLGGLVLAPLALMLPMANWSLMERLLMGAVALAAFPAIVLTQLMNTAERTALAALFHSRFSRLAR